MGRAVIVPTVAPGHLTAGAQVTETAGVHADNHSLVNRAGSRIILICQNGLVVATVTISGLDGADDIVKAIPANETWAFGPFPAALYTQSTGDDIGSIEIELDDDSNVVFYAIIF